MHAPADIISSQLAIALAIIDNLMNLNENKGACNGTGCFRYGDC